MSKCISTINKIKDKDLAKYIAKISKVQGISLEGQDI
jgi:hypothetical protein